MTFITNPNGPSNLTGTDSFDYISADYGGYDNLGDGDNDVINTGSGGGSVVLTLGTDTLRGRGSDEIAASNLHVFSYPDENNEIADFFVIAKSVTINLAQHTYTATYNNPVENVTLTGSGTLRGFSYVFATEGDDLLIGSGYDAKDPRFSNVYGEVFEPRAGDDTIYGGGGRDTLILRVDGSGTSAVVGGAVVNMRTGIATDPHGGQDVFKGIERFILSDLADSFLGGGTEVTVMASKGDDTLRGGTGPGLVDYSELSIGAGLVVRGSRVDKGSLGNDLVVNMAILGTYYADTMIGGAKDDQFLGDYGEDILRGGGGEDVLVGGGADDRIYGGDDSDIIHGDNDTDAAGILAGDDRIWGDGGDDAIVGGGGADTIYGGEGLDTIGGGDGNDRIYGGTEADAMLAGAGDDLIDGGDGDDEADGGDGKDTLYGGDGRDAMAGGEGNDLLKGGTGVDRLRGDGGNDKIYGEIGNDWLWGNVGNDRLEAGDGNDTLFGGAGDDSAFGGGGNDYMDGDAGRDLLRGGAGNDEMMGNAGNDTVMGEGGNDLIRPDAGNDLLNGGAGIDTLELTAFPGSVVGGGDVVVDLAAGKMTSTGWGNDRLIAIEDVIGSSGSDRLTGDGKANLLAGQNGNDTILGGGGDDTLAGGRGVDSLYGGAGNDLIGDSTLANSGGDRMYGGSGNDTLSGGAGNDLLSGAAGADLLDGGEDDDRMIGGAGDDVFLASAGHDILVDFTPGADRIDLRDDAVTYLFASLDDIEAHVVNVNAGTMVLQISDSSTLTLSGVGFDEIGFGDFLV